jgi:hypothetical protein
MSASRPRAARRTTTENYEWSGLSGEGNNCCRNPDGEAGPWCYTTDGDTRWELCTVGAAGACDFTPGASVCTSCANRFSDGLETGVDCGGTTCARRCPVGEGRQTGSDCATGKCDAARGVCRALTPHDTCTDAEQNCFEVDLDCGGEECCEDGYTCSDGKFCAIDGDCTSGQCSIPRLLRRL